MIWGNDQVASSNGNANCFWEEPAKAQPTPPTSTKANVQQNGTGKPLAKSQTVSNMQTIANNPKTNQNASKTNTTISKTNSSSNVSTAANPTPNNNSKKAKGGNANSKKGKFNQHSVISANINSIVVRVFQMAMMSLVLGAPRHFQLITILLMVSLKKKRKIHFPSLKFQFYVSFVKKKQCQHLCLSCVTLSHRLRSRITFGCIWVSRLKMQPKKSSMLCNNMTFSFIGETKECGEFAKHFLERRSKYKNQQRAANAHIDDMSSPAPALTPGLTSASDGQEAKVSHFIQFRLNSIAFIFLPLFFFVVFENFRARPKRTKRRIK